jgi:sterol 3beta-glucosyltransferase
VDKEG